jgi:hypothetical protein
MAPVFNRADADLRRPLGSQSSAHRRRLDVDENRPARHLGAENPNIPHGHDLEYDEAHDVPAGPLGRTPATHRVTPLSKVNLGADGDYGYDEARFRRHLNNQHLTSRTYRGLAHRPISQWSSQGGGRTRCTMYWEIGEIAARGGDIRARCSVDTAHHTATSALFVTPFPG